MLLKEVRVKNFRCLKEISVPLNETTILIGENNAGKTTFLDALRQGLTRLRTRTSPFDEYDYYMKEANFDPKESEGIVIDLIFQEEKPNQWSERVKQLLGEICQPIQFDEDPEEAVNLIWLRISSLYEETLKDFSLTTEFLNYKGDPLPQKVQSNTKYNDFLKHTPVFYMQALRDIKESFSTNSHFWGKFLKKMDLPKERLKEMQENLLTINTELITSDPNLDKMIQSLEQINSVLSIKEGDVVSINALPLKSWDLLSKAQVVLKGRGSDVEFPLDRHGQGTQSLAIIFLFQAYVDILLKLVYDRESEAILTLEEPEAHLHPHTVRELARRINDIKCQKIITTHSPYIFQNMNLKDLRVFRRRGAETSVHYLVETVSVNIPEHVSLKKFITAKKDKYKYSPSNFLTVNAPIDVHEQNALRGMYPDGDVGKAIDKLISDSQVIITASERYELHTYVQRSRGELFFARGWLLAEGQTEYVLLQYFSEVMNLPLDAHGVSFIDYQNNGSPGAFVKLAKALEYPWILLSDSDQQLKSTLAQLNKIGCAEDCERLAILPYPDIETFLVHEGFLEAYQAILGTKIEEISINSSDRNYPIKIAELIKKDKVGNAYKLISHLKENSFTLDKIPKLLAQLIERGVDYANDKG